MTCHELREKTFKMIFGIEFHTGLDPKESLLIYMEVSFDGKIQDQERNEIIEKVLKIHEKKEELDQLIDGVAEGWKTGRMGKAELNILRLALYEIRYDPVVPVKVAINEAVELSKEYGSAEAPAFVNGILAKLIDQRAPEAAQKEGEGSQEAGC